MISDKLRQLSYDILMRPYKTNTLSWYAQHHVKSFYHNFVWLVFCERPVQFDEQELRPKKFGPLKTHHLTRATSYSEGKTAVSIDFDASEGCFKRY